MTWFHRNAPVIEAVAAALTAVVAVAALIGVKIQLDEADRLQTAAAARDAYRAHLALSVANPAFARPANGCALLSSDRSGAYVAYVDHLLYSAELMLVTEDGWEPVFADILGNHSDYLCSRYSPTGDTPELARLIQAFKTSSCPAALTCQ